MDPDTRDLLGAVDAGQVGTFRRHRRNECLRTAASLIQRSVSLRAATLHGRIALLYRRRGRQTPHADAIDHLIAEADRWASVDLGDRHLREIIGLAVFPMETSNSSRDTRSMDLSRSTRHDIC